MMKRGDIAQGVALRGWSEYNGYTGEILGYEDWEGIIYYSWKPFRDNPLKPLRRSYAGIAQPITGITEEKLRRL